MTDELIDLVDASGAIIATMKRSEAFAQKRKNFRLVCALIRNENRFFIPRRAPIKADYPNALACVGGCVISGESYEEGLKREVFEEVMLDISTVSYKFLGFISPFEYTVNGYVAVYEITVPHTNISFEKNDFSEAFWLTTQEIQERLQQGDMATTNLKTILNLYYKV